MLIHPIEFNNGLADLDLDSRSQECKKAKLHQLMNYLTKFQSFRIEFGIVMRLVGMMNLILILSHQLSIQGREAYLRDFVEKQTSMLVYIQTFTNRFLSNSV